MKKLSIFLALSTMLIDQLTKFLVVENFSENLTIIKLSNFLNLVLVYNRGISFGLFNGIDYSNNIFSLVSLIIIGFLLKWLKNSAILVESIALGLIIGGAFGNVLDRIFRSGVVDFIQLHWEGYYWPNFNVADSAICLGVIILTILSIDFKRKQK